eukprot:472180-Amorphochlora_amoeboformis.AAC.1
MKYITSTDLASTPNNYSTSIGTRGSGFRPCPPGLEGNQHPDLTSLSPHKISHRTPKRRPRHIPPRT